MLPYLPDRGDRTTSCKPPIRVGRIRHRSAYSAMMFMVARTAVQVLFVASLQVERVHTCRTPRSLHRAVNPLSLCDDARHIAKRRLQRQDQRQRLAARQLLADPKVALVTRKRRGEPTAAPTPACGTAAIGQDARTKRTVVSIVEVESSLQWSKTAKLLALCFTNITTPAHWRWCSRLRERQRRFASDSVAPTGVRVCSKWGCGYPIVKWQ
jgi:hypothetical protein